MRVYTAHIRVGSAAPDEDAVLVKEGFCWPAFLFTLLWALFHRLWWVLLGLFVVGLALSLALEALALHPLIEGAAMLGYQLIIGYVANDLRRWTLARRGFEQVAVVAAPDRAAAEQRFFAARFDESGAWGGAAGAAG